MLNEKVQYTAENAIERLKESHAAEMQALRKVHALEVKHLQEEITTQRQRIEQLTSEIDDLKPKTDDPEELALQEKEASNYMHGFQDVTGTDILGNTPLHNAADGGNVRAMKWILRQNADVNAKNPKNEFTPLHYAAQGRHVAAIELLLDYNADRNAKTSIAIGGRTPLQVYQQKGNEKHVIDMLTPQ